MWDINRVSIVNYEVNHVIAVDAVCILQKTAEDLSELGALPRLIHGRITIIPGGWASPRRRYRSLSPPLSPPLSTPLSPPLRPPLSPPFKPPLKSPPYASQFPVPSSLSPVPCPQFAAPSSLPPVPCPKPPVPSALSAVPCPKFLSPTPCRQFLVRSPLCSKRQSCLG